MLSARNVMNGNIVYDNYRLITDNDFDFENRRTSIEPGDVLVTIVGALGRTAVVPESAKPFTVQRSVAVLKPQWIEPEFLAFFIESPVVQRWFSENARGTAQKGVYLKTLGGLKVLWPSMIEQRAIVAKIEALFSELDHGVEQLEAVRAQLKRYRQAVLKAAFEGKLTADWRAEQQKQGKLPTADKLLAQIKQERADRYEQQLTEWKQTVKDWEAAGGRDSGEKKPRKPAKPKSFPPLTDKENTKLPDLPEKWVWIRLGNALSQISDGPFGSNLKTADYVDSGVLVVRLENIGVQEFFDEKETFVTEAKYESIKKHTVASGDIIFSSFLSDEVRACVLPESIQKAINKADCFCLRPTDSVSNRYLCQSFSIRAFYKSLVHHVHGATRPRVNTTQVQEAPVPICSVEEQSAILEILDEKFSIIDQLDQVVQQEITHANALRQSILKRAFEGELLSKSELELVHDSPDYEPAEELLVRIREEREKAEKNKSKQRTKQKAKQTSGGAK
jgi:type I restriction enzyme S subunit